LVCWFFSSAHLKSLQKNIWWRIYFSIQKKVSNKIFYNNISSYNWPRRAAKTRHSVLFLFFIFLCGHMKSKNESLKTLLKRSYFQNVSFANFCLAVIVNLVQECTMDDLWALTLVSEVREKSKNKTNIVILLNINYPAMKQSLVT
jgi:hypothetical protein